MSERYKKFQAMVQGKVDYTLPVSPIGRENDESGIMMVIGAEEGAIYITREQAMNFFGFKEDAGEPDGYLCNGLVHRDHKAASECKDCRPMWLGDKS